MKISLEEIEAVLLKRNIDPVKVQTIVKDLTDIVEELKDDKVKEPKLKWEHVIILNDPNNELEGKELAGWVVTQKDGEDAVTVLSKLRDAANTQNEGAKKKKLLLTSMTEIFEYLKPKFLKEKNLKIKTKELTRVIITK